MSEPEESRKRLEKLYAFDTLPDLDALVEAQGVKPVENIEDLYGDFWPEDESVDDFIAAAMEGRHEEEGEHMNEVIGKLSDQHLQEWRKVCATRDAVVNNPGAFTAEESIQAYMDYFTLGGRFFEVYNIDASEEWRVSPWSGDIYYET